jgi:hypothetical protein
VFPFFYFCWMTWPSLSQKELMSQCNITTTYYNFNLFVLFFSSFSYSPSYFFTSSPSIAAVTAATTPRFYTKRTLMKKKKKIFICMLRICTHEKEESSWRWRATLTRVFWRNNFFIITEKEKRKKETNT